MSKATPGWSGGRRESTRENQVADGGGEPCLKEPVGVVLSIAEEEAPMASFLRGRTWNGGAGLGGTSRHTWQRLTRSFTGSQGAIRTSVRTNSRSTTRAGNQESRVESAPTDERLASLPERKGKSPALCCLRFHIRRGKSWSGG